MYYVDKDTYLIQSKVRYKHLKAKSPSFFDNQSNVTRLACNKGISLVTLHILVFFWMDANAPSMQEMCNCDTVNREIFVAESL
jgi:hypothetical protein